ncbi:MAG: hypothetical protein H7124_15730 [Phycisphaerales bacterium]|nr:hypothetical protein [Hyphomonadaceae bacterium]
MQFIVLGSFNDKFGKMSPADQQAGMESEWAKSREYYSKGLLRQIWLFEAEQSIMSVFEADSREHMESLLADYPGMKAGWVTGEIRKADAYGGFVPDLV